jgi:hypothetical protein
MQQFGTCSDDFYINLNVNTEMELNQNRESVLHFFEQLKKRYPLMRNFYSRERGEFVLEEDKDRGHYRWAAVEPKRFCSGYVNPPSADEAMSQHATILELAPFALTASPLDCESVNLMYGFDFNYRGNHNELVVEALGLPVAFDSLVDELQGKPVAYEPALQIAIDEDCRLQCRISVETRTSAYHVRDATYPDEQISVYVTARRYGSLDGTETFVDVMRKLDATCREVIHTYVAERVLLPMQQAIAMK